MDGVLPDRGAQTVSADVRVQVVDVLPIGTSRESQLEAARRQLTEQKRALPITQLDEPEDDAPVPKSSALSRFTVRDSHGTMRYLIFHDQQPAIALSARLVIKQGCEVHRDVLVATARDVVVESPGTDLSLEQHIWRLERPS